MTSPSHNSGAASGDALTSDSSSGDDNAVETNPLALAIPTTSTPAPPAKNGDGEMTIAMKLAGSKRKRNLPGTPDPDAEVVALSPKTLMATHKFTCEVCGRGFQREQNLQLHKRGHNLPGSLKPRATKEKDVRKKVYVCPEETCVHHDPSRALGDLTGIKKHFCRKHGEKKWHCDKCSKRYAVLSDWKAHSKTCGTRDYKCECGSVFFSFMPWCNCVRDAYFTTLGWKMCAEETVLKHIKHFVMNSPRRVQNWQQRRKPPSWLHKVGNRFGPLPLGETCDAADTETYLSGSNGDVPIAKIESPLYYSGKAGSQVEDGGRRWK